MGKKNVWLTPVSRYAVSMAKAVSMFLCLRRLMGYARFKFLCLRRFWGYARF